MEYSTTWITATKPDWYDMDYLNHAADVTYGTICCLCFLLGTVGNIVSFLYFKAKKRNISSVIYMVITANDVVVSVMVVPVGVSFLSERSRGIVFGTSLSCKAWFYLWHIAVLHSVFLVLCLSITRTLSLIRPFQQQKIRNLLKAIVAYLMLILAMRIGFHIQLDTEFSPWLARCALSPKSGGTVILILEIISDLLYIVPAFVVATSCIISAVLLTRRNKMADVQELQQSRKRATVTILLFALVYGVCNVPLVVDYILKTYARHTSNWEWYLDVYQFDTQLYYMNAIYTVLLAVNSAANPILYFWRMPKLREFIRGILRLNGENRRPPNIVNQQRRRLAAASLETRV